MLDGVLVVTGGASGIGLACAKAMVAAHDQVALIDVNEDGLAAAAASSGGAAASGGDGRAVEPRDAIVVVATLVGEVEGHRVGEQRVAGQPMVRRGVSSNRRPRTETCT